MRIICGTDFSIHANSAALAAATLAARLDLPLTLVHVLDPDKYSNPSPELMAYLRNCRQKKLQVLAERAGRKGVIVETAIIEGSPAEKLAQFANESRARFLVVSAIGQIAPTQWLAGSASPFVREWVPFHSNFPPLFPLLLAATGGATGDFLAGHIVVALCAIAALVLLYRFAALVLASDRAGLAVVVLFLLTPTAWVGILPLQSETLYLLISLGALLWHAGRMEEGSSPRDGLVLGPGDDGDLAGQRRRPAQAVDLPRVRGAHQPQQQVVALGRVGGQVLRLEVEPARRPAAQHRAAHSGVVVAHCATHFSYDTYSMPNSGSFSRRP